MIYKLTNKNDPGYSIGLTRAAWFGILKLAEQYGWNPVGTSIPEWETGMSSFITYDAGEKELPRGNYFGDEYQLVLLEDALNLADALEIAALEYEPRWIRSLNYYILFGDPTNLNGGQPSLGAIQKVIDLCNSGPFLIEED